MFVILFAASLELFAVFNRFGYKPKHNTTKRIRFVERQLEETGWENVNEQEQENEQDDDKIAPAVADTPQCSEAERGVGAKDGKGVEERDSDALQKKATVF